MSARMRASFRSHESEYDKVLADIVNRVVVAMWWMIYPCRLWRKDSASCIAHSRSADDPRGGDRDRLRESVSGSGSAGEEGQRRCTAPYESAPLGLPVDSVGWAESVSESAGRELLKEIPSGIYCQLRSDLGGEKVRISLIPQGTIVRTGSPCTRPPFRASLMLRAVNETEHAFEVLKGFRSLLSPAIRRIWLPSMNALRQGPLH